MKENQSKDFHEAVGNLAKSNKKVAEKWHKEMIKLIHPDRCKHPKATEAMQTLEKLYKGMI